jgi:hypothetical protein
MEQSYIVVGDTGKCWIYSSAAMTCWLKQEGAGKFMQRSVLEEEELKGKQPQHNRV